jgi:hypothetical protein
MMPDASSPTPAGVVPQSAKPKAMTIHEASRTLLKSSPELWAECSDAASLSRHLGQFGEIKITRLEPETAVAWEGAHVSGTVRLEPSGWGTRVILTAEEAEVPYLPPPAPPVVAAEPPEAAHVGAELASADAAESVAEPASADAAESVAEPASADAAESAAEPASADAAESAAEPEPVTATGPPPPRKGVFARFFARMRGEAQQQEVAVPRPHPETSLEPQSASEPERGSTLEPRSASEPERWSTFEPQSASEPQPDPAHESQPQPGSVPLLAAEPELEAVPPAAAAAAALATETGLKDALESLGSAHHRPFSRS